MTADRMPRELSHPSQPLPCSKRPELFFPEHGGSSAEARELCASCPVLEICREWAIPHEPYGVWGGLSERERAMIRRRGRIGLTEPELPPPSPTAKRDSHANNERRLAALVAAAGEGCPELTAVSAREATRRAMALLGPDVPRVREWLARRGVRTCRSATYKIARAWRGDARPLEVAA